MEISATMDGPSRLPYNRYRAAEAARVRDLIKLKALVCSCVACLERMPHG